MIRSIYFIPTRDNWLGYDINNLKNGKTEIFKFSEKRNYFIHKAEVFTNINFSADVILTNGISFLLILYGVSKENGIDRQVQIFELHGKYKEQ